MSIQKKYVRFQFGSKPLKHFGLVVDDKVLEISDAPWRTHSKTGKEFEFSKVTLVAPVVPTKIVCVGLNYHAHVDASQSATKAPEQPMLFLKPPSSIIGPDEMIVHPAQSQRVDFEAELAIVFAGQVRNVKKEDALDHLLGFTCVNDVTARDLQKSDGQWGRAKGFDTFCPVGPMIVSNIDYDNLNVEGILNGQIKQSGNTKNMIFDIPTIISYVSSIMTLEPGDIIATGTPAGIEPMKPGDTIEIKIDQIGSLKNSVIAEND